MSDGETTVVYDEAARSVTTTITNTDGSHSTKVSIYNADLRLVSRHWVRTSSDGATDLELEYDGGRLLSFHIGTNGSVVSIERYFFATCL